MAPSGSHRAKFYAPVALVAAALIGYLSGRLQDTRPSPSQVMTESGGPVDQEMGQGPGAHSNGPLGGLSRNSETHDQSGGSGHAGERNGAHGDASLPAHGAAGPRAFPVRSPAPKPRDIPEKLTLITRNATQDHHQVLVENIACSFAIRESDGSSSEILSDESLSLWPGDTYAFDVATDRRCVTQIDCDVKFMTPLEEPRISVSPHIVRRVPAKGCIREAEIHWTSREQVALRETRAQ